MHHIVRHEHAPGDAGGPVFRALRIYVRFAEIFAVHDAVFIDGDHAFVRTAEHDFFVRCGARKDVDGQRCLRGLFRVLDEHQRALFRKFDRFHIDMLYGTDDRPADQQDHENDQRQQNDRCDHNFFHCRILFQISIRLYRFFAVKANTHAFTPK